MRASATEGEFGLGTIFRSLRVWTRAGFRWQSENNGLQATRFSGRMVRGAQRQMEREMETEKRQ
jgi:hypothetical protein